MLRRIPTLLLFILLAAAVFVRPAHIASAATRPHLDRVMIRLSGPPLATNPNLKTRDTWTRGHFRLDPNLEPARRYSTALSRYQQQELAYLRHQGIKLQVIRTFGLLFNGFAALVPSSQMAQLRSLDNVSAVLPDRTNVLYDERSIGLINAPQAWSNVGGSSNAGAGEYIAVVDTGIQISNPCFSDKGMPPPKFQRRADSTANFALTNNKVVVARAFGTYPGKQYSAADVQGHGTFVGGVIACDYNTPTPIGAKINGVAPKAYLMSYNIYPNGDDGRGPEDAAIAAFQAAFNDGADVLNYSSGFPSGAGDEQYDAEVEAINNEARAGLTIAVSAGNAGPYPLTISSPSTASGAISVGSSTNDRNISESVLVGGPTAPPADLQSVKGVEGDHPFTQVVGPAPVVPVGYGRVPGDSSDQPSANDFAGKDLHGKIALIERGDLIPFETKLNNAAKAGAIGAVVWDNQKELDYPIMEEKSATLPAMFINLADGQALSRWIAAHPDTTVTLNPALSAKSEPANLLSDFSSRGFGPDYRIKPDIVAPGQDIYSSAQTTTTSGDVYDPSGFASEEGTSFSAPHVAGVAALILQQHPTWTPAMVKAAMMETASIDAITDPDVPVPSVMDVGAGLVDAQTAVAAKGYLLPASTSFGPVNVGYGQQQESSTLTLHDLGGGAGAWSVHVLPLHTTSGLQVAVPLSVTLAASGQVSVPVQLTASPSTAAGNYDGYIVLEQGTQSLHVPYFVHVASLGVKAGSVLLVDDSTSVYQPAAPNTPIAHLNVSNYYESALGAIGKSYTYWNEAAQGSPDIADLKRASAAIYFTGNNLNFFAHQNSDPQALDGPLNVIDLMNIHAYLNAGGHVFVTGMGAALSDQVWDAVVMGAQLGGLSEYDNSHNDTNATGGMSPPKPSATVDTRTFGHKNPWLFRGFKPIDFSTKGDGAGDNVAVNNLAIGDLVGVSDLDPYFDISKKDAPYNAFGQAVLRTTDIKHDDGSGDVAVVNSDEPSFKNTGKLYPGRSVIFGFGFEGINDNTGYTTRAQVLSRIFQWFDDKPASKVVHSTYRSGRTVTLRSSTRAGNGIKPVQYQWQIGSKTLKASAKPTTYRFPHAGSYRLRVLVTDSVGHAALSPWTVIKVH